MKHFLHILCLLIALTASALAQPAGPFTVSPLETRVFGQNTWLRGGPAALRVIVLNHKTGQPVPAQVRLALTGPKKAVQSLWAGRTSALGTVDALFDAPKIKPGAYTLRVEVDSPIGDDTVTQSLTLAEAARTLLSSDKPLYQPGQTMHLRALALDSATRQPLAGTPLTFEVEDARGNKVFKKQQMLSRYGIASADFTLADEVNMGSFTLRAVTASGQTEKTVRVERYVLPKFKASVTTDKPYYLPGETVHGTLEAHYFFGKPVSQASVTLTVNTVDIGVTKLGELTGKTDDAGKYVFDYTLPTSFVGLPFEQGKAVVEFAGTVKDTADQTQETHTSLPVVKEPILLVMVPEHRGLVPGVENRVFIAAATPDGQPIKGVSLAVNAAPEEAGDFLNMPTHLTTDALGLATYSFTPDARPFVVTAAAEDAEGHTAIVTQRLADAPSEEALILRADKTLAKVGDTLTLAAVSTVKGGTLYLDIVRNKQTILTRAVDMKGGQAMLTLPVTDDMAGTIELHAYKILPNEDIVRDTRTIIVAPADDLTVKVAADQAEYKPGGDATLRFSVTGPSGAPVQAALGLAMVDESVFALSELQPGLQKVYFTLEKELMEPKYEIHGLTPQGLFLEQEARKERGDKSLSLERVVLRTKESRIPASEGRTSGSERDLSPRSDAPRQRAAAMLLASAPASDGFDWRVNTYQIKVQKVQEAARAEMVKALTHITAALAKYRQETHSSLTAEQSLTELVSKGCLKQSVLVDPWGHWYRANLYGNRTYDGYFTLSSAGPDGLWDTADDIRDVPVYAVRMLGAVFRARGAFGGGGGFPGGGAVVEEQDRFAVNGAVEDRPISAVPAPMMLKAALPDGVHRVFALQYNNSLAAGQSPALRVRSYFPETMYWNPALITDDAGHAEVRVPMADSITTWRLSMLASGLGGQLGSATAPVKVFQDFFADIDLPVALTQHDSVEIPVTVYNYLPHAQDVTLTLDQQPWFTLRGPAAQTLSIGPGEVKVVYYPITVVSLGH
ncbi:MAG: MG2 domain-containing protein, partial [Armatimonadota bacterium]|nr:MG2 domain-containing protein [Armatimonadota bacterium]